MVVAYLSHTITNKLQTEWIRVFISQLLQQLTVSSDKRFFPSHRPTSNLRFDYHSDDKFMEPQSVLLTILINIGLALTGSMVDWLTVQYRNEKVEGESNEILSNDRRNRPSGSFNTLCWQPWTQFALVLRHQFWVCNEVNYWNKYWFSSISLFLSEGQITVESMSKKSAENADSLGAVEANGEVM